jgi:hypothetical protein
MGNFRQLYTFVGVADTPHLWTDRTAVVATWEKSETLSSLLGCHESTKGRRREKGRAGNELRTQMATYPTSLPFVSSFFRAFVANSSLFSDMRPNSDTKVSKIPGNCVPEFIRYNRTFPTGG